jgi:hypothetical protein
VSQAESASTRSATERWFVRVGLPHLIRDYSAREDILTRAAPALALVFVSEVVLAGDLGWPWWHNLAAILAGAALVVAIVVAANRARGRGAFALPDTVGVPEIAVFLVAPPLLRLAFGDDLVQAVQTLLTNIVVLFVVYLAVSYGVLPTILWAIRQLLTQFRSIGTLLARSLPLLLLVTMFMFFNAELWKVVDDLPSGFLAVAIGILVGAGAAFVLLFQRTGIDEIATFAWWTDVHAAAADTPVADVDVSSLPDPPSVPALERSARLNVNVLYFFLQATQIVVVTLAVTSFYVVFGLFTIQESTIVQWTGSTTVEAMVMTDLWGSAFGLTGELLRTALFVGAIAGLQFTVTSLTDQQYRSQFNQEVTGGLRTAMAVRAVYRARATVGACRRTSPGSRSRGRARAGLPRTGPPTRPVAGRRTPITSRPSSNRSASCCTTPRPSCRASPCSTWVAGEGRPRAARRRPSGRQDAPPVSTSPPSSSTRRGGGHRAASTWTGSWPTRNATTSAARRTTRSSRGSA